MIFNFLDPVSLKLGEYHRLIDELKNETLTITTLKVSRYPFLCKYMYLIAISYECQRNMLGNTYVFRYEK